MLIGSYLHPLSILGSFGKAGEAGQIVACFDDAEFEGIVEPGWRGDDIGHRVSFQAASINKKKACPSGAVPARSNVGAAQTPCTYPEESTFW